MVIYHLEFADDLIIAKSKWTWLCPIFTPLFKVVDGNAKCHIFLP